MVLNPFDCSCTAPWWTQNVINKNLTCKAMVRMNVLLLKDTAFQFIFLYEFSMDVQAVMAVGAALVAMMSAVKAELGIISGVVVVKEKAAAQHTILEC